MFRSNIIIALVVLPAVGMAEKVTYTDHVRPILEAHCMSCHNVDKAKGDVILDTFEAVMQGGGSGAIVEAGDPDASTLYTTMAHIDEPYMPQKASKRPDAEINLIKKWIAEGLLKDSGSKAIVVKKKSIALDPGALVMKRPEGPPPMPGPLLLDPEVLVARETAVHAMDASPWAPLVAVGGIKQILLYHQDTREFLGVLPFPEGVVNRVRFSRNGAYLLAAGGEPGRAGRYAVWRLADGERIASGGKDFDAILDADIRADLSVVVTGGPDKMIRLIEPASGEVLRKIKKHTDWVTAVAFSPDGVLMATGDRNGNLYVWETETGIEFYTLTGHKGGITALAWRSDSNVLASSGEDGAVFTWNMHDGKSLKSWKSHGAGVLDVRFLTDGRLVSSGRDSAVRLWSGDGKMEKQFKRDGSFFIQALASHDFSKVWAGSFDGRVDCWNVADTKAIGVVDLRPPSIAQRLVALAQQRDGVVAELAQVTPQWDEAKRRVDQAAGTAAAASQALQTGRVVHQEAQQAVAALWDAPHPAIPETGPLPVISRNELARREEAVRNAMAPVAGLEKRAQEAGAAVQAMEEAFAAATTRKNEVSKRLEHLDGQIKRWQGAEQFKEVLRRRKVVRERQAALEQAKSETEAAAQRVQKAEEELRAAVAEESEAHKKFESYTL